ncbi:cytochrome c family protein [Novosphingobium sp. Rr 2-17]|uniref:c-type cytochrome n=1 Tax=Novosphingobium sp. Rr 2-17 TaxID=555793 RepID=UPI0002698EB5|nr:c-type cytochrome [Novosphingobium sp. Rr 2-17]EIZ79923.1 cytochrome c family protein [Novosphingobium sp. Rr 2-17]
MPIVLSGPSGRRKLIWIGLALAAALVVLVMVVRSNHSQAAVLRADPESILDDPALRKTALDGGKPVFEQHCAACHGANGKGNQAEGIPNLTDDDHLYGVGTVAQIEDIVRYGIRAHNKRGWNLAVMPAYATAVPDKAEPLPTLKPAQIEDLTQFLLSFTGRATDKDAITRGHATYETAGCWDCHGQDVGGDGAIGAPSLTDDVWLFGGSHDQIYRTIAYGRAGMSPAFNRTLTPAQIRNVAAYTASLAPKPVEQQ